MQPAVNWSPGYTVVVPAYNEAESLTELVERIDRIFRTGFPDSQPHEILVIDDGSTDGTAARLDELSRRFPQLRRLTLRRNCGKSMALTIGFRAARGKVVVTLDADLQDRPEDIPQLIAQLDKGFDLVSGARQRRQDTAARRLGSYIFNRTVKHVTGLNLTDLNCGLKAYRADVVKTISIYGQFHRYIPLLAHFAGFRVSEVAVQNDPRRYGTSKYRTFRYQGLLDLMSILFTQNYHLSPLHFFAIVSALFIVPGALLFFYFTAKHILWLAGYPSMIVNNGPLFSAAMTSIMVGVNIFTTGFLCDFVLHHLLRDRIDRISNTYILEEPDMESNVVVTTHPTRLQSGTGE